MSDTQTNQHQLEIYNKKLDSRFILGSANYPSPAVLQEAMVASSTQLVTVGLKRQVAQSGKAGDVFFDALKTCIKAHAIEFLPNTAGCYSAREAIQLAHMAHELFATNLIKVEVIGDAHTLAPDPFELVEAVTQLVKDGFEVLPYCTDDLILCNRLLDAGAKVLMPWASPIGSGQGLLNPYALKTLRARFSDVTLIIDAGLRSPSDAAMAMELGFDGVLLNTAIAGSHHPVLMAKAFKAAVQAGRMAYEAGLIPKQDFATPSTPVAGRPFIG